MNLINQINSHKYLYLKKLNEVSDLELEIWINEAGVESNNATDENASSYVTIVENESTKKYKIKIEGYVAYSVINESFDQINESEQFEGKLFRIYSTSNFMEYISNTVNMFYVEELFGRRPKHFQIVCLNHIIDIVCDEDFAIEELPN